jgi:hypothetical protein
MTASAFATMVDTLSNPKVSTSNITTTQYEVFCYEYLFDCLRGQTFGQAFCEKFSIVDNVLLHTMKNEYDARKYITKMGYVVEG